MRRGRFREDLYYRLRGATLTVPPLRERPIDIPKLIDAFMTEALQPGQASRLTVTPAALRVLAAYPWPGNVRELWSEVKRWVVFCDRTVDVGDLAPEIVAGARDVAVVPAITRRNVRAKGEVLRKLADVVAEAERGAIESAFALHDGNVWRTAKALGIERNTLKRKLRAFGLYPV